MKLALKVDNPGGEWLNRMRAEAHNAGMNKYGTPNRFGPVTATFNRDVMLPMAIVREIRGLRAEQSRVGEDTLRWLMSYMSEHGEFPKLRDGEAATYNPFLQVDLDGAPWTSEGNHRIMAADRLGWTDIPLTIRYFCGGEAVHGVVSPDAVVQFDREAIQKGHTPTNYGGRIAMTQPVPFPNPMAALLKMAADRAWSAAIVGSKRQSLLAAMGRHPSTYEGKKEQVVALYGHGPELLRVSAGSGEAGYLVETYSVLQDRWLCQKEYPATGSGREAAIDDAMHWYPLPNGSPSVVSTPFQAKIPDQVLRQLRGAVDRLHEIGERIAEARTLSTRFGGNGRYVDDVLDNRRTDIESARNVLAKFRSLAPQNNIDAEQVIAGLGGEVILPDRCNPTTLVPAPAVQSECGRQESLVSDSPEP
jgi:hypothetical protein